MSLTASQKHWLLELWKADNYTAGKWLSVQVDRPPTSVMRALEKKGLCKDVMGTFWAITEAGKDAATEIY